MNTSIIEARGSAGKRLGVLLLGLAVALAGTFAFSGSQAEAVEKTITFDKGKVNLGFAFQNRDILPGQPALDPRSRTAAAVEDVVFDVGVPVVIEIARGVVRKRSAHDAVRVDTDLARQAA